MQIFLNSRNELSWLVSSPLLFMGEELPPPSLEAVTFLNSRGGLDVDEAFDLPNARVDWTAFFLGEGDFLALNSEKQSLNELSSVVII